VACDGATLGAVAPARLLNQDISHCFDCTIFLISRKKLLLPPPVSGIYPTVWFWIFPMSNMRDERLQVMLSPEELTAVDDFRFKHQMPTRGAAARELLRLGLTVAASDGAGMKSSNYGASPRSGRTARSGSDPEAVGNFPMRIG
jgi:hypothetical protein